MLIPQKFKKKKQVFRRSSIVFVSVSRLLGILFENVSMGEFVLPSANSLYISSLTIVLDLQFF